MSYVITLTIGILVIIVCLLMLAESLLLYFRDYKNRQKNMVKKIELCNGMCGARFNCSNANTEKCQPINNTECKYYKKLWLE
jgi:hypothetical protein